MDFVDFDSGVLALRLDAWEKIEKELQGEVEALDITVEGHSYILMNVTNVIDCLDRHNSDFMTLANGKIYMIKKTVFLDDDIRDSFLFKIPELPYKKIYATNKLMDLIRRTRLTGLDFLDPDFKF